MVSATVMLGLERQSSSQTVIKCHLCLLWFSLLNFYHDSDGLKVSVQCRMSPAQMWCDGVQMSDSLYLTIVFLPF